MASREEVLASMRAPTPQGLDMKQVLQALAGAAAQGGPSTSWGYGMRVSDAQKEGALGNQSKKDEAAQIQQAMGNAMAQDEQMFDRAAKAHSMAMQERQMALSAAAHAAEMQYKQARLPLELEAARLNIEKVKQEIAAEQELAKQSINGVPLSLLRKMNPSTVQAMGLDSKSQQQQRNREGLLKQKFSEEGADILSRISDLPEFLRKLSSDVATAEKNLPVLAGRKSYPKIADGTGGMRPMTPSEFRANELNSRLRQTIPGLKDTDYQLLNGMGGVLPAIGVLPAQDARRQRNSQLANELLQELGLQ